jgi:hypothetical protein
MSKYLAEKSFGITEGALSFVSHIERRIELADIAPNIAFVTP